ncbi:DNA replication initiation control protein YabA [Lacticaseibacillus nasuensis]|uniref:Replication initiation control protein YabA n=1 Tax=Lacticaseibacillus nasuensis JCM 17158 TaxID=1291734 RepID=A0A0R1JPS2_9LACO|nr:DNA replication initiation control protein YabA [Lacticaseibacillus nasuensis]KRK70372.1 hypothetical protein FD02_GL000436 [Lacticaseibacillus nasuensis JCM 17158]
MEKKDLYDGFVQVEQDLQRTMTAMARLKADMTNVLEQNAELEIENKHLREHLQELQNTDHHSTGAEELSKSKANLQKLYEEGFHVCSVMYGQRRIDDESCAFCLEVIYGEHR